jgi:hypothetical protein
VTRAREPARERLPTFPFPMIPTLSAMPETMRQGARGCTARAVLPLGWWNGRLRRHGPG